MSTKTIELSVIVPCKNAEKHISVCLDALLKQEIPSIKLEIIIVDNGSTDNTLKILDKYRSSVNVLSLPLGTISEVRNYGAMCSTGEWLAFIDADVEVDVSWGANLVRVINKFENENTDVYNIITGSTYFIPENSCWIEQIWFEQLKSRDKSSNRYINGGNLILHRELFDKIGGFDLTYETCEDEKLCLDARSHGGKIIKEKSIMAIHHGYPKSLNQFFNRERWHGLGLINEIWHPWRSRDLLLSLYYIFVLIMALIMVFSHGDGVMLAGASLLALILPVMMLATIRCLSRPSYILPLTLLYFIHACARTCSLFDVMLLRIRGALK